MSSILRINDSKKIQLINEWENYPCLWNTKLVDYRDKMARAGAVEQIAQILNIPNFTAWHVVTKFKNLRNSYRQELKKIAADHKYQPRVAWFPHMDRFLRPHLQKHSSQAELPPNSNNVDKTTDEVVTDIITQWSSGNSTHDEESFTDIKVENTNEDDENSNKSYAKRSKIVEDFADSAGETSQEGASDYFKDTAVAVSLKCPPIEDKSVIIQKDHYDAFGVYVASLLRMLPPRKALIMQPKIVKFLINAGVEELNQS